MKEFVTKVIDTLTQEDFHGAFQKLSKRYNKCITAGGDYFEGDKSFMCVLSIKVLIQKKSGNLSYAPRSYQFGNENFEFSLRQNKVHKRRLSSSEFLFFHYFFFK